MIRAETIWPRVHPRLQQYLVQTWINTQAWDIERICKVADATPGTVGDWLVGTQPPTGIRLLSLWHFLKASGIPSPEIDDLPPYNRYLGELLALKVITMEDARTILDVGNDNTVLAHLRGQQASRPLYSLPQLREEYDKHLQQARQALPKVDDGQKSTPTAKPDTPKGPEQMAPAQAGATIEVAATSLHPQGLTADQPVFLAMLLNAALPLARHIASDAVTVEKRTEFRGLIGQENLFELLNTITALQSERARINRR